MIKNVKLFYLVLSFLSGIAIHILKLKYYEDSNPIINSVQLKNKYNILHISKHRDSYKKWLHKNNITFDKPKNIKNFKKHLESDYLGVKVPLFCVIIFTSSRASVFDTFSPHCNKVVFVKSSKKLQKEQRFFEIYHVPDTNNWNNFLKLLHPFLNHKQKCEWFVFLSEKTFLIAENLRYFLSVFDPKELHYVGRPINNLLPLNSGIFINRRLLKLIADDVTQTNTASKCTSTNTFELGLASCVHSFNIAPSNANFWDYNAVTDFPIDIYFNDMQEWFETSINPSISLPTEKKKLSRNLITFINSGFVPKHLLEFVVYKWKPWAPTTDHPYIHLH